MNSSLELKNQLNESSYLNSSNISFIEYCLIPKDFDSLYELFECYGALFQTRYEESFLEFGLAIGTVLLNLLVAILIFTKPVKLSVFDQILIGHCIVDGVTGLIDIPL